ncbi:alpha/beta fold hydrolase [Streptomyces sp. NPDC016845]|uniref:alpha/beta fold hydrolase n=1 Tax=Streptomyces sp. NPDC016845 TaxID=3364972 RepID=UPI0037B227AE
MPRVLPSGRRLLEATSSARIVWGREDRILPPEYAEWLHARIPPAELHWIEGAGHLLQ